MLVSSVGKRRRLVHILNGWRCFLLFDRSWSGRLLGNLLSPAKPKETTLHDIVQRLKSHYDPAPLEITESFHFGMRNQHAGESISDYIVALKK